MHFFQYVIYLIAILFLYWMANQNKLLQKIILGSASFIFLVWISWASALFLSFSALFTFLFKTKYEDRKNLIPIFFNLLAYVSYLKVNFEHSALFLIGGSFYCFKLISYSLDKRNRQSENLLDYFLWIFYSPTLISGPIQNFSDFLDSYNNKKNLADLRIDEIFFRIIRGLFKKIVLVKICTSLIASYSAASHTLMDSIIILFINFLQITLDFSAYVDIAISISLLFGIVVPENFNFSYNASNISDFWKRHHITLGLWFAEYVYNPVLKVSNRKFNVKRSMLIATCVVFLISGVWHVSSWNGLIFFALNFLSYCLLFYNIHPRMKFLHRLYMWCAVLISFWMIIYSMQSFIDLFKNVDALMPIAHTYVSAFLILGLFLFILDKMNNQKDLKILPSVASSIIHCLLLIVTIINSTETIHSFIYTRF